MPTPDLYETPRSRKFRQDAASGAMTREWVVRYTQDPLEVRDLLLANNEIYFMGLSRKSIQADTLGAPDLWMGYVEYGVSAILDGLKPDELSFKVGSQTVHVTQSKETLFRISPTDDLDTAEGKNLVVDATTNTHVTPDGHTPVTGDVGKDLVIQAGSPAAWTQDTYTITGVSGGAWVLDASPAAVNSTGGVWALQLAPSDIGTAPDYEGAIGVDLETVHGCDVLVPKMEFTYSRQRESVDFPYLRTLRSLVGKTNDAEFFGFAAGSLLYLGCEPSSAIGHLDTGDKFLFWNLAHSFGQEENRVRLSVGPVTIPQKRGWEYVWARYDPTISSGRLVRTPSAVYVERLYDPGNFELLEIGGGES